MWSGILFFSAFLFIVALYFLSFSLTWLLFDFGLTYHSPLPSVCSPTLFEHFNPSLHRMVVFLSPGEVLTDNRLTIPELLVVLVCFLT